MTRSVAQADPRGWFYRLVFGWGNWTPPVLSDELSCIDDWDGPWRDPVLDRAVDIERTAALSSVDLPISANAGKAPWQGSTYGMPINLADRRRNTTVRNLARGGAVSVLPLPSVTMIEGDPAGSSDRALRLVDPVAMSCWEAIQAHVMPDGSVNVAYAGAGSGMVRWDMSERWDPATSPQGGVIAAEVPQTPLIVRGDEIARGRIGHTLAFVPPNYSPDHTGWARHSDGTAPRSPIRAGDILRLSCISYVRACQRFEAGTAERTICDALYEFGMVCVDKSTTGDPAKGKAGLVLALDRRFATLRDLGLRLTDFELIQTTN